MPKMEKYDPLARKVDVVVNKGSGSLLDKLRQRRRAIESGNIEDENTPEKIKERGYKKHSFDEEDI